MDCLLLLFGFILIGNLVENWRRFEQQYDVYVVVSGVVSKGDKIQGMILFYVLGLDVIDVYNIFMWIEDEDKIKLVDIKKKFKEYCNLRKNVIYERYGFNMRIQKEGEFVDVFVIEF